MSPAYLLGPVAREVRILSWRAIWWILEHIQECAYYVYRDERNSGKMSSLEIDFQLGYERRSILLEMYH